MSNTTSVSSATTYQTDTLNQGKYAQLARSFQAIGTALQSGNLASAQSALATFQQNLPTNSTASASQPFGKNSQANTDYQNLTAALNSGDTTSAQQAYTSLRNELESKVSPHRGHHRRSSSATDSAATPSGTTSSLSASSQTGTGATPSSDDSLLNTTA